MQKKICPVCDLPIKASGYCPRCKRIIKNPYLREIDYYLNETHPSNELECEFHNPYLEADHHGENQGTQSYRGSYDKSGTKPANQSSGGRSIAQNAGRQAGSTGNSGAGNNGAGNGGAGLNGRAGMAGSAGAAGGTGTAGRGSYAGASAGNSAEGYGPGGQNAGGTGNQVYRRSPAAGGQTAGTYRTSPTGGYTGSAGTSGNNSGNGNSAKIVMTVLFASVAAIFLITIIGVGGYTGTGTKESEEYTEAYSDYGYDNYQELTDEDVIAAGVPCSGYTHFPGDSSGMVDSLWEVVKNSSYGYTVNSEDSYTDNYVYDESYSYYENDHTLYLDDVLTADMSEDDEDYYYQYVDLNLDTATGQLHEYISNLVSRAASVEFLGHVLRLAEENSGVPAQESQVEAIIAEVTDSVNSGQNNYIYQGIFIVELFQNGDSLYISVNYNSPEEADAEL